MKTLVRGNLILPDGVDARCREAIIRATIGGQSIEIDRLTLPEGIQAHDWVDLRLNHATGLYEVTSWRPNHDRPKIQTTPLSHAARIACGTIAG